MKAVKLLLLSMLTSWFTVQAHATVKTEVVKEASGKTNLVVKNNTQKDLPPAQLGIAPPNISGDIVFGKTFNETLTLYNYSKAPKSLKLSIIDINEANQPVRPSEQTLTPWTLINPTEFTIPVDGEQTIRLVFNTPEGFPKKTHKAMLLIEEQLQNQYVYDKTKQELTMKLGSRYALPITISVK